MFVGPSFVINSMFGLAGGARCKNAMKRLQQEETAEWTDILHMVTSVERHDRLPW